MFGNIANEDNAEENLNGQMSKNNSKEHKRILFFIIIQS